MKRVMTIVLALVATFAPEVTTAVRAQGPREGIVVHGHWSIEVRHPDGTVASHTDFENALVPATGGVSIGTLLSRTAVPGQWLILMDNTNPQSPVPCVPACVLTEPSSTFQYASPTGKNLTIASGPVLTATVTATQAGAINHVTTAIETCAGNTMTPQACAATTQALPRPFSEATLASPIAVAAGQTIQVTVTFSYS